MSTSTEQRSARGSRDSRQQRSRSATSRRRHRWWRRDRRRHRRGGRRSGAYVVTVDPGVTVDGLGQEEAPAETTADRIVAAGGAARASNTSVTDAAAIDALFAGLVDEFGGLDAVINVAGISRPSGFAEGDEPAWTSVLSVHLDGYLNVLAVGVADHERGGTRPHPRVSPRAPGGDPRTRARTAARSVRSRRSPGNWGRPRRRGSP